MTLQGQQAEAWTIPGWCPGQVYGHPPWPGAHPSLFVFPASPVCFIHSHSKTEGLAVFRLQLIHCFSSQIKPNLSISFGQIESDLFTPVPWLN